MRPIVAVGLLFVLPVLLLAGPAPLLHADDEPPAPKAGEPTPLQPAPALKAIRLPFRLEALVPADGARPEGWGPATTSQPEAAPSTAALLRVARSAGVDTEKVSARCIPLARGTGEATVHGTLGYLVIDVEATTLTPKLEALAQANGWTLTPVGVPSAVLVTWAGDAQAAAALHAWQAATAVHNLCARGWTTMLSARQQFDRGQQQFLWAKGQAMVAAARETMPAAGYVNAILAQLVRNDPARSLDFARKALDAKAPVPPPESMLVTSAFTVAGQLLTTGSQEDLPEVIAVLERALAWEEAAENAFHRFGNRYNLACAYARQGKVDAAFPHLEESLRFLKAAWEAEKAKALDGSSTLGYPDHYAHAKSRDADMAPLREDPRFAAIMARYDPAAKAPAPAGGAPKPGR